MRPPFLEIYKDISVLYDLTDSYVVRRSIQLRTQRAINIGLFIDTGSSDEVHLVSKAPLSLNLNF